MQSRRTRAVLACLAASSIWAVTSAESCSQASKDLNKASQGLDALTATCSQLIGNPGAERDFVQAEADQANRADQPESKTKAQARASLERRCGASQNPNYQPYVDVQTDISGP
jgi:hypothetical protein